MCREYFSRRSALTLLPHGEGGRGDEGKRPGTYAFSVPLWFKILLLGVMLISPSPFTGGKVAFAQPTDTSSAYTVFTRRVEGDPASRELIFVDAVTSEQTVLTLRGERFTISGQQVLFYDPSRARVMVATPDGETTEHPFMQMVVPPEGVSARRIDWVATRDGKLLAWTQTNADASGQLSTVTQFAHADGEDQRIILSDGPRQDGLRAMPVAFNNSHMRLYMDYQPDGVTGLTAYPQYAGLFTLELNEAQPTPQFLPGEPGNFTGAGFGSGYFLRLSLTPDLAAFDVRVYGLDAGLDWTISALRLRGFTQAGDILVSPDGQYAVYALSQITRFGTPEQAIQTVFMLVDLTDMSQVELTDPITEFVRPAAWTEDDTAVIFTSPQRDGTWKISLNDQNLVKVAEATYLGVLDMGG